jgi:hypothetical protein
MGLFTHSSFRDRVGGKEYCCSLKQMFLKFILYCIFSLEARLRAKF